MNLNSIIFPAPKSSYSIEMLQGELIWIPKYSKEITQPSQNENSSFTISQEPSISTMISNESHKLKPKDPGTALKVVNKQEFDIETDPFTTIPTNQGSPNKLNRVRGKHIPPPRAVKINPRYAYSRFEHSQLIESKKLDPHFDSFDEIEVNASVPNEYTEENFGDINEFEEVDKFSKVNCSVSSGINIKPLPLKTLKSRKDLSHRGKEERVTIEPSISASSFRTALLSKGSEQWDFSSPTLVAKRDAKKFSNPLWNLNKTIDLDTRPKFHSAMKIQMQPLYEPDLIDQRKTLPSRTELDASLCDGERKLNIPQLYKHEARKIIPNIGKHVKPASTAAVESYIPCLLLQSEVPTDKILVYFHGNGEDIYLAYELASHLRDHLNIHTLTVEYPGYGLYKGVPEEETIMKDAEAVYDYLTNKLSIEHKNILVCGRSIGSGPATYLCSQREVGALILVSGFTSIRAVVKDFAGSWAQYLIKQRFNNVEAIKKVKSPTFIVHGQRDRLIPFTHSEELHSHCKAVSELVLPKEMDHIEFDFFEDLTCHLKNFFQRCGIKLNRSGKRAIYFPRVLFRTPDMVLSSKKKCKIQQAEAHAKKVNSKSMVEPAGISIQ